MQSLRDELYAKLTITPPGGRPNEALRQEVNRRSRRAGGVTDAKCGSRSSGSRKKRTTRQRWAVRYGLGRRSL